METNTATRQL